MSTVAFNFQDVKGDISLFEDGYYEATVVNANADLSPQKMTPFIGLELDVFSETHGTARLYDKLYQTFPPKAAAFYGSVYGMTVQEVAAQEGEVDLDTDDLIGANVIVYIKKGEPQPKRNDPTQTVRFTNTERPWYVPASRADLLNDNTPATPVSDEELESLDLPV